MLLVCFKKIGVQFLKYLKNKKYGK